MGTPIRRGRDFAPRGRPRRAGRDRQRGAGAAVLQESGSDRAAHQLGARTGIEIVGVAANAKYMTLREQDMPTIYMYALEPGRTGGPRADGGHVMAIRRRWSRRCGGRCSRSRRRCACAQPQTLRRPHRSLARHRAADGAAARAFARARAAARGGRPLRRARLLGGAPDRRDRTAPGARRVAPGRCCAACCGSRRCWSRSARRSACPQPLLLSRTLASLLFDVTPIGSARSSPAASLCLFAVATARRRRAGLARVESRAARRVATGVEMPKLQSACSATFFIAAA